MKKVMICGGRNYGVLDPKKVLEHPKRRAERAKVDEVLREVAARLGPFLVLNGRATGADALADAWARRQDGFPEPRRFPADWEDLDAPGAVVRTRRDGTKYNLLAGLARNQKMIDERPDLVVAFPGGGGTADAVERARAAGIEVMEIT